MSFVERRITLSFAGPQTLTFENLRVHARVRMGGSPGMGAAEVAIYGMSLSHINQLSTFGRAIHIYYDYQLTIMAGDEVNGMSTIFTGAVTQAWGDFQSAPDVPFHVVAMSGIIPQVQAKSQAWNSYAGTADVATMMKKLAGEMGYGFQNNGVTAKLENPYHFGSPRVQAKQIAEAARIGWTIENNILVIWPASGNTGDSGLVVSPQTVLVSYPTFTEYGVLVKTRFKRPVKYGTKITVESDLTPACGSWIVALQDYDLQARTPNGHWFLSLGCTKDGSPIPFIGGA